MPRLAGRSMLVVLLCVMLAACQQQQAAPPSGSQSSSSTKPAAGAPARPAAGGELRVALESDVVALDPPMFTDVYSNYVSSQIHETLFQVDYDMKVVPMLAEKVEQPNDTTYVITLREGVKFHNGEELTSDDVKFTFA